MVCMVEQNNIKKIIVMEIILTVQPIGSGKFRLGIPYYDSKNVFKNRGIILELVLSQTITVLSKTTCGPPLKKGFDIYSREISDWIIYNNFHNYQKRKPTKLRFEFDDINNIKILKFTEKIKHKST